MQMTRFITLVLVGLSSLSMLSAQTNQAGSGGDLLAGLLVSGSQDELSLELDTMLESNYYKLLTSNKKNSGVPGFRIRIFSKSGVGAKEEQQRIRARFLTLYPDVDAYYRYDEPYFKVYVGDCRTKSEALLLYDRIMRNFPSPIVVDDYINLKDDD